MRSARRHPDYDSRGRIAGADPTFQQMTGEQRLALAFELYELSCNVAREGIRHQNPQADEAEIERQLGRRLQLAWQ